MRPLFIFLLLVPLACFADLKIPNSELKIIGDKIWVNECGKKVEGLTHWNVGEDFGSFGIGHFIWYPEGQSGRFQESFPSLLLFLKEKGVVLPKWLAQIKGCPWKNRDTFYQQIQSPHMVELRQLLYDTRDLQVHFIAESLQKTFPEIVSQLPEQKSKSVKAVFDKLARSPRGLFALIDYSNFKGMGSSPSESYKNQGWGLLQVLEQISPKSKDPVADFVAAAKKVLEQRVRNAPPEQHEERWLKGWINRIESY